MSSNWAYNLDMLAQNGVIDFDGASFVTGQKPRYVGRPSMPPSPYVGNVPPAPALNQLEIDEFKQEKPKLPQKETADNDIVNNPSWKKWVFGALALGGLALAGYKIKPVNKWIRDFIKAPSSKIKTKVKWQDIKDFISDKWRTVKDFCLKGWNKLRNVFKSTP